MIRNVATEEGRDLGVEMARFCDIAEPVARLKAPELTPRCASCAFRAGKHLANGSPETQMTALKCVAENEPFYCHDVHREGQLCSGWAMLRLAYDTDPVKCPWDFVDGADKEKPADVSADGHSSLG